VPKKSLKEVEQERRERASPEGYAYIGVCSRCDNPCLFGYLWGSRVKLSRWSVPLSDALVLEKYWEVIVVLRPDMWTERKMNQKGRPVRFFIVTFAGKKPERGRIYTQHYCRRRKW
jgi:hypothetical protein